MLKVFYNRLWARLLEVLERLTAKFVETERLRVDYRGDIYGPLRDSGQHMYPAFVNDPYAPFLDGLYTRVFRIDPDQTASLRLTAGRLSCVWAIAHAGRRHNVRMEVTVRIEHNFTTYTVVSHFFLCIHVDQFAEIVVRNRHTDRITLLATVMEVEKNYRPR